uniref:BZIP domain-containing protein n=1 Tax=Aegilops tauschii subsp. strangulata TaxID=200361 RepID=A0A453R3B0_AEGTS
GDAGRERRGRRAGQAGVDLLAHLRRVPERARRRRQGLRVHEHGRAAPQHLDGRGVQRHRGHPDAGHHGRPGVQCRRPTPAAAAAAAAAAAGHPAPGLHDAAPHEPPAAPAPAPAQVQAQAQAEAQAQRQQTLGRMTLEEFLVRAGVVREDMGGQTVVVPARAQALFPQGNVVAPTMQVANAVVHGVVGQGPGVPMTVAAPTTPGVLNGFGKMEGGDLSSLSPVPYPFDTVTRARKGPTVEKVVERRQRRMIKNRESAARSRQRKQAYIMELEAEVAKLKENNEALQKKQVEMLQKQKDEVIERIEKQLGPKAKRFCLRRTLTGPW